MRISGEESWIHRSFLGAATAVLIIATGEAIKNNSKIHYLLKTQLQVCFG